MAKQISRQPEQGIRFYPVVDTRHATVLHYTVILPERDLSHDNTGASGWQRDLGQVEATLEMLLGLQRTGNIDTMRLSLPVKPALLQDSDFIDALHRLLDDYALSTDVLGLDLAEPSMLDLTDLDALLAPLKALGIEISLDNYLPDSRRIPALVAAHLDCLKLHEHVVTHLHNTTTICRFLHGMAQLCDVLSKTIVVKGVNNQAQHELLQSLGLHYMQGLYFSEPLLATELATFEAELARQRKHDT